MLEPSVVNGDIALSDGVEVDVISELVARGSEVQTYLALQSGIHCRQCQRRTSERFRSSSIFWTL
jgi:hypothetical protein